MTFSERESPPTPSTPELGYINSEYWIFGYGSLIFKPPPHYDIRVPGYVRGYVRRFWQSSNDHRGTPESPGRVVTLIDREFWSTLNDPHPMPEDEITWGVAYRIQKDKVDFVKDYLDLREQNGYSAQVVPFILDKQGKSEILDSKVTLHQLPSVIPTVVYIGTPDNEAFVGPQDPEELAAHIVKSRGPSGQNTEYLYKLGEALRRLAPSSYDHHIEDLILRAKTIEGVK